MVKNNLPIFLLSFLLASALCFGDENPAMRGKREIKGWCVASTAAPIDQLQSFLDYGCSEFDCSPIQPGGACFTPDNILAHASWILDKFYKVGAFCKDGLGFITEINPSHDGCQFP
ncbi:hypothetical protein ABFS82_02G087200 [Erythranthe guttata]